MLRRGICLCFLPVNPPLPHHLLVRQQQLFISSSSSTWSLLLAPSSLATTTAARPRQQVDRSFRQTTYPPQMSQLDMEPPKAEGDDILGIISAHMLEEDGGDDDGELREGPCSGMPPLPSSSFSSDGAPAAGGDLSDKELRKLRKKEAKAARRARREGALNLKPCDLCSKNRDLLIRCQKDETRQWFMVCGPCWKGVSGGVVDGDSDHPFYRYGGLWRAR